MRVIFNLAGLLLVLAAAAWVGKNMLSTSVQPGTSPSEVPLPKTGADARATIDQARRDLDEAAKQSAQRSADADR